MYRLLSVCRIRRPRLEWYVFFGRQYRYLYLYTMPWTTTAYYLKHRSREQARVSGYTDFIRTRRREHLILLRRTKTKVPTMPLPHLDPLLRPHRDCPLCHLLSATNIFIYICIYIYIYIYIYCCRTYKYRVGIETKSNRGPILLKNRCI